VKNPLLNPLLKKWSKKSKLGAKNPLLKKWSKKSKLVAKNLKDILLFYNIFAQLFLKVEIIFLLNFF